MNFTEEENFPRGGKKPKIKPTLKRPKEDDNVSQTFTFVLSFMIIIFAVISCRKCSKSKKGQERQEIKR